jgi:hypothetical protein
MPALRKMLQDGGIPHDEAAMIQMILTEGCRRLIISKFMDGEDNKVECIDLEGAVPCDRCESSESGFDAEYGNWESSSVAAPQLQQHKANGRKSKAESDGRYAISYFANSTMYFKIFGQQYTQRA